MSEWVCCSAAQWMILCFFYVFFAILFMFGINSCLVVNLMCVRSFRWLLRMLGSGSVYEPRRWKWCRSMWLLESEPISLSNSGNSWPKPKEIPIDNSREMIGQHKVIDSLLNGMARRFFSLVILRPRPSSHAVSRPNSFSSKKERKKIVENCSRGYQRKKGIFRMGALVTARQIRIDWTSARPLPFLVSAHRLNCRTCQSLVAGIRLWGKREEERDGERERGKKMENDCERVQRKVVCAPVSLCNECFRIKFQTHN